MDFCVKLSLQISHLKGLFGSKYFLLLAEIVEFVGDDEAEAEADADEPELRPDDDSNELVLLFAVDVVVVDEADAAAAAAAAAAATAAACNADDIEESETLVCTPPALVGVGADVGGVWLLWLLS